MEMGNGCNGPKPNLRPVLTPKKPLPKKKKKKKNFPVDNNLKKVIDFLLANVRRESKMIVNL